MDSRLIILGFLFIALISTGITVFAQIEITPAGNRIPNDSNDNISGSITSISQQLIKIEGKLNSLVSKDDLVKATNYISTSDADLINRKSSDNLLITGILMFFTLLGSFCVFFILKGKGVI